MNIVYLISILYYYFAYYYSSTLLKHLESEHNINRDNFDSYVDEGLIPVTKITCKYCGKTMAGRYNYLKHRSEAHPDIPVKGKSSDNNASFASSSSSLSSSTTTKPTCEYCGKVFGGKSALTIHKKYYHPDFYYQDGDGDETDKPSKKKSEYFIFIILVNNFTFSINTIQHFIRGFIVAAILVCLTIFSFGIVRFLR